MKIRSAYNYDRAAASRQGGLSCPEETRTKQEFLEEVNINTLIERFKLGAKLPVLERMPSYEDFSDVYDFKTAVDALAKSREAYDKMPAAVRKRFGDDPQRFLDWCEDDRNYEEAMGLGLISPDKHEVRMAKAGMEQTASHPPTGKEPKPHQAPGKGISGDVA